MNINQNNYEVFFIDYYDGTLSAEQSAELFLFLESNPELKEEFDSFSNVQLEIPEMQFPDRDLLKRGEVPVSNIDEKLVAYLEGDLSSGEIKKLESDMQSNPQIKKDSELYQATVSVPDLSIVYPNKKSLKKPVPFYIAYRNEIRFSIAAVLMLGFIAGTVSIFNRTMEHSTIQVAEENPVVTPSAPLQPRNSGSSVSPVPGTQINNLPIEKTGMANESLTAEKSESVAAPGQRNKQPVEPVNESPVITDVPVQLAEVMPAGQVTVIEEEAPVASRPIADAAQPLVANSNEQYMTVWEALRQSSEKNLKKFVAKEEPVLAYADDTDDSKPTLVDVVSKGLEKVSNDKVKLDSDKQNKHFSFSAGNFKIEKR